MNNQVRRLLRQLTWQEYMPCRKFERPLNKCVLEQLVRATSLTAEPGQAHSRLAGGQAPNPREGEPRDFTAAEVGCLPSIGILSLSYTTQVVPRPPYLGRPRVMALAPQEGPVHLCESRPTHLAIPRGIPRRG